jgi:hypothetical protein
MLTRDGGNKTDDLDATLNVLAGAMTAAEDDWWIFGSAAMPLHGFEVDAVKDIDVLVSSKDAHRLMARHSLANVADGGSGRFRSDVVLRPAFGAVPVEILADFRIRNSGTWQVMAVTTRVELLLASGPIFIPSREELAAIFLACGRPKDIERAQALLSES